MSGVMSAGCEEMAGRSPPTGSCLHWRTRFPLRVAYRAARLRRRCINVIFSVLGGAALACCCRGWPLRVGAIELTITPEMVQNMRSANETAARFSSTDYVDLTCKVCFVSCWVYKRLYSRMCGLNTVHYTAAQQYSLHGVWA